MCSDMFTDGCEKVVYFWVWCWLLNVQNNRTWMRKTILTWDSTVHVLVPNEFLPASMFYITVWETLHDEGLYPYHIQIIQHLEPGHKGRWLEFCCCFDAHPHSHHYIVFTNKAQFTHSEVNNTRNSHVWAYDNPHGIAYSNFHFFVNMWCGIMVTSWLDHRLSHVWQVTFTLDFLQLSLLEKVPLQTLQTYYQHKSTPPNFMKTIMQHLNKQFPGQWNGCGSPLNWPLWSPDLSPQAFHVWGLHEIHGVWMQGGHKRWTTSISFQWCNTC